MPDLIANRYDILSELGRGGFATVYRALDTRLNREIALKILNPVLGSDPRFRELFHREAQTAASLKHPHIVTIHDTGEFDQRLFIIMELLAGLDVRRQVERDGALPLPLAVSVIEQIASALDYAHGRGIIHRDVKAANILLDEAGHATLTDFGLVRAIESSAYGSSVSLSGGFVGSVEYIPPEQVDGQPATPLSDQYSLGVVAYEMVTGQLPFKADKPVAVAVMHATKAPPDPRGLRAAVPPGLSAALLRVLSKAPGERFANMAAFAAALREGLERPAKEAAEQEARAARKRQEAEEQAREAARRAAELAALDAKRQQDEQEARKARRLQEEEEARKKDVAAALAAQRQREAEAVTAPAAVPGGDGVASQPQAKTPWGLILGAVGVLGAVIIIALLVSGNRAAPPPTPAPALGIGSTRVSDKDGMTLLYVPAGEFTMGAASTDTQAGAAEKPLHTVYLDAYWIDQTEVTNAMFKKFVDATHYQTDAEKQGSGTVFDTTTKTWRDTKGADWQHPRGPSSNLNGLDDHPVVQVSWNDATAYCQWAGGALPTEAQWEKAARGTDQRVYPWGNEPPDANRLNFNTNMGDTTEVGKYPSGVSPYGALDMAGNAWEWLKDWYGEKYYASSPERNPSPLYTFDI